MRWEYRPGSAFYLVWSHNRYDDQPIGQNFDFAASRSHLWSLDANNVFLAKFTYYFNLQARTGPDAGQTRQACMTRVSLRRRLMHKLRDAPSPPRPRG
jgi:hypothetical protein